MTRHTSDEALAGGAAQGSRGVAQSVSLNFASASAEDKVFYTFRAQLALAGHALSRSDAADGPVHFYVTRLGLVRELRDFADVRDFAEQLGVQL